jgi:hypothetical protein
MRQAILHSVFQTIRKMFSPKCWCVRLVALHICVVRVTAIIGHPPRALWGCTSCQRPYESTAPDWRWCLEGNGFKLQANNSYFAVYVVIRRLEDAFETLFHIRHSLSHNLTLHNWQFKMISSNIWTDKSSVTKRNTSLQAANSDYNSFCALEDCLALLDFSFSWSSAVQDVLPRGTF